MKKSYKKNPKSAAAQASKALQMVSKIQKEINQREIKNVDNQITAQTITYSGFLTSFNVVGQGVGNGQRVGDKLTCEGLDMRFQIVNSGATTTMTRVIVLQDLKDTMSSASQILDVVGSSLAPLSPYQRENRNNFKILYDKVFCTDSVKQGQVVVKWNHRFKRGNQPSQTYDPGAGTLTENSFRVLFISDVNAALPTVDSILRFYYSDA